MPLELLIIGLAYLVLRRQLTVVKSGSTATFAPNQPSPRLAQLSDYADRLYAERKWLAAEKAYLNVLKLDHKNVTAYSHLGVIYSTQKNLADAIECFQIATRLRPSGATFQNLGLAFYDNRNYVKSVAAYEKAIMLEASASRYVGLSKAYRRLANFPAAASALEKAIQLEPSPKLNQLLAEIRADASPPSA
jgi:tetratricopeptide (TPR) repeat protein